MQSKHREETMNALDVTQRQLNGYNAHDPDALIALYTEGATYHSPRSDHPLKGQALADFFKSLFTAFPDMRLEVISSGDTGGGLVASQWVLHGTHTGPYMDGTPPTGRTVTYPVRSTYTLTDRQWLSNWGSHPKKLEVRS
jgi:predicted ester cyclase